MDNSDFPPSPSLTDEEVLAFGSKCLGYRNPTFDGIILYNGQRPTEDDPIWMSLYNGIANVFSVESLLVNLKLWCQLHKTRLEISYGNPLFEEDYMFTVRIVIYDANGDVSRIIESDAYDHHLCVALVRAALYASPYAEIRA